MVLTRPGAHSQPRKRGMQKEVDLGNLLHPLGLVDQNMGSQGHQEIRSELVGSHVLDQKRMNQGH